MTTKISRPLKPSQGSKITRPQAEKITKYLRAKMRPKPKTGFQMGDRDAGFQMGQRPRNPFQMGGSSTNSPRPYENPNWGGGRNPRHPPRKPRHRLPFERKI